MLSVEAVTTGYYNSCHFGRDLGLHALQPNWLQIGLQLGRR